MDEFARVLEAAFQLSAPAGQDNVDSGLNWEEPTIRSPLAQVKQIRDDEPTIKFIPASLVTEQINGSKLLADQKNRETLIDLSQAGFVREKDILSRRAKKRDEVKTALEVLKKENLIVSEFLIECRKNGSSLARISDRSQLTESGVGNLICPSCTARFTQEHVLEGYSLSELGQKLSRQSHWMTVWITDLLIELGIRAEAIIWNATAKGEEVDLLVEYLDQLWIFELKAREFGSGDVHAFNYRRVRYRASKGFIVTTEKVSQDAKVVLDDLEQQSRESETGNWSGFIYIEGLASAKEILEREISEASFTHALRRLGPIESVLRHDLAPILAARLNIPLETRLAPVDPYDEVLF
ncbi:MAG: hypothetical protein M3464_07350 [Chloroflexota bacterium]|nr:hypothetical protein [Chloroflexota bacterium]